MLCSDDLYVKVHLQQGEFWHLFLFVWWRRLRSRDFLLQPCFPIIVYFVLLVADIVLAVILSLAVLAVRLWIWSQVKDVAWTSCHFCCNLRLYVEQIAGSDCQRYLSLSLLAHLQKAFCWLLPLSCRFWVWPCRPSWSTRWGTRPEPLLCWRCRPSSPRPRPSTRSCRMLLCTSSPGGAWGFCWWFWESLMLSLCNAWVWRSKDLFLLLWP